MISRRSLLPLGAALLGSTFLVSCTQAQLQTVASDAVADLGLIEAGLTNFGPLLQTVTGVPANILTTANSIIADAEAAAKTIDATVTNVAASPIVGKVEGYATSLITLVLPYLPAGSAALLILTAINSLLPVVAAAVTSVETGLASASVTPSVLSPNLTYVPPAQARQILQTA